MKETTITLLQTSRPADGVVDVPIAQKIRNASSIRLSEFRLALPTVPFVVQLKFRTSNPDNLRVIDQLQDDTYISMGTQVNQIWDDQHDPPLPLVEFPQNHAQIGRFQFSVVDENGAPIAWTALAMRLVIHYEGVPQARDSMNWAQSPQAVQGNSASAKSTAW